VVHLAVSEHNRGHLFGNFPTCHVLTLIKMGFQNELADIQLRVVSLGIHLIDGNFFSDKLIYMYQKLI